MTTPAMQEEQLLELMLQLRKTTPESAHAILNSQPQIAYALMAVMVNINAVKVDVIQKTVADFTANATAAAAPAPAPAPVIPPIAPSRPPSNVLPHMHNTTQPPAGPYGRHGMPSAPPTAPSYYGHPGPSYQPTPPPVHNPYGSMAGPPPGYGTPPAPPAASAAFQLPPAFASLPEDQKAMVIKVIAMSPEELDRLPPAQRASLMQVRQTLGLPM